jgi:3-oxoacyl-[acyl-carrier protein] reductase
MKRRQYGRIVNVSSVWSLVTKEGRLPYSASKSALNGITRTLAVELAPHNVLVNAVAPGYVNTELTRKNNTPEAIKAFAEQLPIQRLAEPREIAELVAFLCSARNSYITGQVIAIDGGFLCK